MSVLENSTPYAGHRAHTASSSGPIHHHYLLNFAVSIAAILFGIAIIAAFALAVKWRKRTTQQYLLEPRTDARIPQSSISDVSDGRSTISIKFPPPGLSPPRNRQPFLPRTPPHAHHPPSHARALRTCQSCIAGLNNRPPCYCPTCPNGPDWDNPPAYRASPPFSDVITSPRLSATFIGPNNASPPRPSTTDENAIRRNSQHLARQAVRPNGQTHIQPVQDFQTPAGHARGNTAATGEDATGWSSASSSPTLNSSSVSSATAYPRPGPSIANPSSLQLSDNTRATAWNPGRRLDTIANRGPLGLAVSCDPSNETFASIQVTPPSNDGLDVTSHGTRNGERMSAGGPPSEPGPCAYGQSPSIIVDEGRDPLSGRSNDSESPKASAAGRKPLLADVNWFGEQGPLADHSEQRAFVPGSHSARRAS